MDSAVKTRVGIMFTLPKGLDRRSFLYGLGMGYRATGQTCLVGQPDHPLKHSLLPTDLFTIDNHADEGCPSKHAVRYADGSHVPLEDVRCGCGDPACWILKWSQQE